VTDQEQDSSLIDQNWEASTHEVERGTANLRDSTPGIENKCMSQEEAEDRDIHRKKVESA